MRLNKVQFHQSYMKRFDFKKQWFLIRSSSQEQSPSFVLIDISLSIKIKFRPRGYKLFFTIM